MASFNKKQKVIYPNQTLRWGSWLSRFIVIEYLEEVYLVKFFSFLTEKVIITRATQQNVKKKQNGNLLVKEALVLIQSTQFYLVNEVAVCMMGPNNADARKQNQKKWPLQDTSDSISGKYFKFPLQVKDGLSTLKSIKRFKANCWNTEILHIRRSSSR